MKIAITITVLLGMSTLIILAILIIISLWPKKIKPLTRQDIISDESMEWVANYWRELDSLIKSMAKDKRSIKFHDPNVLECKDKMINE